MPTTVPHCPACHERMEEGGVFEANQHVTNPLAWVEGRPEKRRFRGYSLKGLRKIDLVAYRCPRCGWVVWFAPAESAAP